MFQKFFSKAPAHKKEAASEIVDYTENMYGHEARITDDHYRNRLNSWQIPAIQKHCGDLTGKVFADIGAGDIVFGEKLSQLGVPEIFYAQDLRKSSLDHGLERISAAGHSVERIVTNASQNFDFGFIPDNAIDFAFSNSLFSHLSLNSIILCLTNLSPKMKPNAKYFTSMIVLPTNDYRESFDWHQDGVEGTEVISSSYRDSFHYTANSIALISSFQTGFEFQDIHEYGHPFQKLVEFQRV